MCRESFSVVDIFGALSDQTRLDIVKELLKGEMACADLISRFQLSKSTFSHHAKVLSKCSLVKFRREGKYLFFTLNSEVLQSVFEVFK